MGLGVALCDGCWVCFLRDLAAGHDALSPDCLLVVHLFTSPPPPTPPCLLPQSSRGLTRRPHSSTASCHSVWANIQVELPR